MMIRAADAARPRDAGSPASPATPRSHPDWSPVAAADSASEATDNWDDKVAVDRFDRQGRHPACAATAGLTAPGERHGRARTCSGPGRAIVHQHGDPAVRSRPSRAWPAPRYWTNREAIERHARFRRRSLVLGGGAIGAELAQVFGRFGRPGDRHRGVQGGCCLRRNPRRVTCWPRSSAARVSRCGRAPRPRRSGTTGWPSAWPCPTAPR